MFLKRLPKFLSHALLFGELQKTKFISLVGVRYFSDFRAREKTNGSSRNWQQRKYFVGALSAIILSGLVVIIGQNAKELQILALESIKNKPGDVIKPDKTLSVFNEKEVGFKSYSLSEVASHNSLNKGIWVSFKDSVYDITSFIEQHPGGDKILMAAGGQLEPFWELYAVHKTDQVLKILEQYKIGSLAKEDQINENNAFDPYATDPVRHPLLRQLSKTPCNAEPPAKLLSENFITPEYVTVF